MQPKHHLSHRATTSTTKILILTSLKGNLVFLFGHKLVALFTGTKTLTHKSLNENTLLQEQRCPGA